MVKNTKGGSGHKAMGRKFVVRPDNRKTRLSQDECEIYAMVEKLLGNGMCHVLCNDGKRRLCFIRGKFRGRGKRDNTIVNGTWVLVGGRDYESEKSGEGKDLEKCDLLEVYSDVDKERLKETGQFKEFIEKENTSLRVGLVTDDIIFSNNIGENEYHELMGSIESKKAPSITRVVISDEDGEEEAIDVDDI
jgi:translation initiation factor 1A